MGSASMILLTSENKSEPEQLACLMPRVLQLACF